jgi:hypothetical protein
MPFGFSGTFSVQQEWHSKVTETCIVACYWASGNVALPAAMKTQSDSMISTDTMAVGGYSPVHTFSGNVPPSNYGWLISRNLGTDTARFYNIDPCITPGK